MKTANELRWKIAQKSEKEFWDTNFSEKSILKLEKRCFKKAQFISEECKKIIKLNKKTKILQLGCAALDTINYINVGKRYSIDPLANFYKERFKIDYGEIEFKQGKGENLPYKDNFFDIVILVNVLDHVHIPNKVLSEIKRVLKEKGILYFEVYISTKGFIRIAKAWGFLHSIFGKIFNIHHPYMFLLGDIQNLMSDKFQLVKEFKKIEEDKKLILKILDKLGFLSKIYYRALYLKKENKNEA